MHHDHQQDQYDQCWPLAWAVVACVGPLVWPHTWLQPPSSSSSWLSTLWCVIWSRLRPLTPVVSPPLHPKVMLHICGHTSVPLFLLLFSLSCMLISMGWYWYYVNNNKAISHKWIFIKLAIDPNVHTDVFKINGRVEYRCTAVIELQPRDGRVEALWVFGVRHSSGLAIPNYDRGSSAFISTKISSSPVRWLPRRRLIRSCSLCASKSCFTLALNSQRQSLLSPSSEIQGCGRPKPLSGLALTALFDNTNWTYVFYHERNFLLLGKFEVSSGVLSKPAPFHAPSCKPP